MSMTWEEAADLIEEQQRQQDAERKAARRAITPHVRKPNDRSKLSRHSATSPHNRVAIGAEITGTYCGEPITTEDLDRREIASWLRKDPAAVAERGVCEACIRATVKP